MRNRDRVALMAAAIVAAGCGGSEETPASRENTATRPSRAAQAQAQDVDYYAARFSLAQIRRIVAPEPDLDPHDLVGTWHLDHNRSLKVFELRAPDKGGPVMEILDTRGDTLVLRERGCAKPFAVRLQRAGERLTISRVRGKCPGPIGLLVEQPWQAQAGR